MALLPLDVNVGEGWPAFPGKDGGWRNFLRALRAREPAEPESAKTKTQLPDPPEHRASASE